VVRRGILNTVSAILMFAFIINLSLRILSNSPRRTLTYDEIKKVTLSYKDIFLQFFHIIGLHEMYFYCR
jgi:hypothetical protein